MFLFQFFLRVALATWVCLFPTALFSIPFSEWKKGNLLVNHHIISPAASHFDSHTPSLIEVVPGRLCMVWKGGRGVGKSNSDMKEGVGIWLSFFEEGVWQEPMQIVKAPNSTCWNPVLMQSPDGMLTLFYRMGSDPRRTVSLQKVSHDGGKNWSEEEILPAGIVGPTKSKPVFDHDGNRIIGSSICVGEPTDRLKASSCWIEILSSQGKWSKHGPLQMPGKTFGPTEPVLFWRGINQLRLLCRDRSARIGEEGFIWTAKSQDAGKTWSTLTKTDLPNPDSGIEVLALDATTLLLFYNHSHTERYPLSIAISKDGGDSWNKLFDLEEESGEFPTATLDSQGQVHVAYAWSPSKGAQRQIKHVILDREKMLEMQ